MYYNLKIYLNEQLPIVGLSAECNFDVYDKIKDFVTYAPAAGFVIENDSFGTIVIPSPMIKYAHAVSLSGDMPISDNTFKTVKNISNL